MTLNPESVFAAFWGTALEESQFYEDEEAFEQGREPREIDGNPATEFDAKYRDAIRAICERAAPLIAQQNPHEFPKRCPDGDLDSVFGSDLYMTAAGHGVGFWDGDWDPIGDELTEIVDSQLGRIGSLEEHVNGGLFFI